MSLYDKELPIWLRGIELDPGGGIVSNPGCILRGTTVVPRGDSYSCGGARLKNV